MSTYWLPSGDDDYVVVEAVDLEHVDAHCKLCDRRLQRFSIPTVGGRIGVQPFFKLGRDVASPWRTHEGLIRWHLSCACRHQVPVTDVEVAAVFTLVANGSLKTRRFRV